MDAPSIFMNNGQQLSSLIRKYLIKHQVIVACLISLKIFGGIWNKRTTPKMNCRNSAFLSSTDLILTNINIDILYSESFTIYL